MKRLLAFSLLFAGCSSYPQVAPPNSVEQVCYETTIATCVYNSRCLNTDYELCMEALEETIKVRKGCSELTYIDKVRARKCERALRSGGCEFPSVCDDIFTY